MKQEVMRRLAESASTPVFWTDDDVGDALNEGLAEISDATEWNESYAIVGLYQNQTYYDLRTTLSDTILAPRFCFNTQTNRWLDPVDVRDLDYRTYVRWEVNTGEPQMMFIRGLWWLGLYPKPAGDGGTMKLYFSALPPDMDEGTDGPGFPDEFQRGLIHYALYDLMAQDSETRESLRHWALYKSFEERLRKYVSGRMSLDRVEGYG